MDASTNHEDGKLVTALPWAGYSAKTTTKSKTGVLPWVGYSTGQSTTTQPATTSPPTEFGKIPGLPTFGERLQQAKYWGDPTEYILNPNEYVVPEELRGDPKQLELSAIGLTREQYTGVIEQWKERQIQEGNYQELKDRAKNYVKYGYASDVDQWIANELADQAGIRLLGLSSEWAHTLSDRYTGVSRVGVGLEESARQTTTDTKGVAPFKPYAPEFLIPGMTPPIESAQKAEELSNRAVNSTPALDESGQNITLDLFPTDFGLTEGVQRALFNVSYEGDEIVDWKLRPGVEGVAPIELSFTVNYDTGSMFVVSAGRVVGELDKEAGEFTLLDSFVNEVRGKYMRVYAPTAPVRTWFTGIPVQPKGAISEWLYSKKVIGDKIIPAPAEVLGVVGAIVSLTTMGYQGIAALRQVGWSGVRNELLAPFKSTLDAYISRNTKDIALLAQRDPTTLTRKQRILHNIYNLHNQYMARQAREIHAAQFQARRGGVPTVNIDNQIRQLTSATQTTNSVAEAVKTGRELTTTSLQGLIATGTPTEFTSGISAIITGQAVPAIVEFNPITTPVGKGYEILQYGNKVGEISYNPNVPGVDGIVIGRIDIIPEVQRQGLATQAIDRVLTEAESLGVPLYTGILEADGVQLMNALEQRGVVNLSPAPQRMLGNVVTRGVPEYVPTTAMAEEELTWTTPNKQGQKFAPYRGFVIEDSGLSGDIRFHLLEVDNLGKIKGVLATRETLGEATNRIDRWIEAEALGYPPTTAMAEWGEITPNEGVWEEISKLPEPPMVAQPTAPATAKQIKAGHTIAFTKALINKKGNPTQQYRRLAVSITGQKSMKDMTQAEANAFITAINRYPDPKWSTETGTWKPQSMPRGTAIVPENYFNIKFGEPTPIKYLTSQTYYATKLGVGPLVEPLEVARQEFDLVYPAWRKAIEGKIIELDKAYKITTAEKLKAWKVNKPTRASAEMAQLLNQYEDLPPEMVDKLGKEKVEIFTWFRNLSRTMLTGQNQVREVLNMPTIPHRQAYFAHIADEVAQGVIEGLHPLPSNLAYWSKQVVGKKIFNPRAMQRQISDDLLKYFSKDLGYVTKSMVHTALKEIYLSQPLKAFNAQLNALNADLMPFNSMTQAELERMASISPMPASTHKWVVDYVNYAIKGQQTETDASINRVITQTGLGGMIDTFLKPFGRSIGLKPATKVSQLIGRGIIYATIGTKPRQIIRNFGQVNQSIALNGIVPTLKAFLPADKNLTRMLDNSLYLKGYAIIEEMPSDTMSKVGRLWMWVYGRSAVFNAKRDMKAAYHSKGHYIFNSADAKYGWADPARTYTEPKGFLYDSEYKKLLKEAEFASGAAQYQYNAMGMPEIFRHKTLAPLTRLQSWWMNHFFKFHREALSRLITGHVGWDENIKLNWQDRLNWLKYLLIGGAILTAMGYNRSFGKDVLPHWAPPGAQMLTGLYNYVIADSDYEREQAHRQMFYSLRAFIPGLIDFNFYKDIISGERPITNLFFYTEDWPPDMPTWGIPALVAEVELGQRVKRVNSESEEWISKLGTPIPAEDETDAYTYEMTDLASDIWAELRHVPESYRTTEKGFSDMVVLYETSQSMWNEYYYSLPASERQEFIQKDSPLSIEVGAYLVLWGRLKATGWASGNPDTIAKVEELMGKYNIPFDAVPSMGERQQTTTQDGLPWTGGTTPSTPQTDTTGALPWAGYSGK